MNHFCCCKWSIRQFHFKGWKETVNGIYHVKIFFALPAVYSPYNASGWLGVHCFFLLNAFGSVPKGVWKAGTALPGDTSALLAEQQCGMYSLLRVWFQSCTCCFRSFLLGSLFLDNVGRSCSPGPLFKTQVRSKGRRKGEGIKVWVFLAHFICLFF